MTRPQDDAPNDPAVVAVEAFRKSFEEFWDRLLAVFEISADFSATKLMVELAKVMFLQQSQPTYIDEDTGWTHPSDIAETAQLMVVGTDVIGDQASFGLLLNEMECVAKDFAVTTEFQKIEGGTYGELLRMAAIRYILEYIKDDEEVLLEQVRRIRLANEANEAAGLTGKPPPPRKGLSKQYLRTWEQLKQFWLNEAQLAHLFDPSAS